MCVDTVRNQALYTIECQLSAQKCTERGAKTTKTETNTFSISDFPNYKKQRLTLWVMNLTALPTKPFILKNLSNLLKLSTIYLMRQSLILRV